MTLLDRISEKKSKGYIDEIASGIVGQEIIIKAISMSSMADRVLLKGGIVMYNITSNARRATRDLDFDFIHYDISNNSNIDLFVDLLNRRSEYNIKRFGEITTLHQEDYQGKRVYLEIKDKTYSFRIKLDIGVHTLFAIEQTSIEFRFNQNGDTITLFANPVEQIIAEKLYSLAKHGVTSTRYKDVFDVYYLINNQPINRRVLNECITLLIEYGKSNVKDIEDLCERIKDTFDSKLWYQRLLSSDQNWIEINNYQELLNKVVDYIYSL